MKESLWFYDKLQIWIIFQTWHYWLLARLIYIVLIQKKELDIGNVALKCFLLWMYVAERDKTRLKRMIH